MCIKLTINGNFDFSGKYHGNRALQPISIKDFMAVTIYGKAMESFMHWLISVVGFVNTLLHSNIIFALTVQKLVNHFVRNSSAQAHVILELV